jgi:hypothetical protein
MMPDIKRESWRLAAIHNLIRHIRDAVKGRAFAGVTNGHWYTLILMYNGRERGLGSEPSPLVNLKVVPQVPPLDHRHGGVDNPRHEAHSFQTVLLKKDSFDLSPYSTPTRTRWAYLILFVLGAIGICWGWGNNGHGDWGCICVVVGSLIMFFSAFVVLPWLADL